MCDGAGETRFVDGPKPGSGQSGGNRQDARLEVVDVRDGALNKSIEVRPRGIRVGCTFVTKEAVEFILARWKEAS